MDQCFVYPSNLCIRNLVYCQLNEIWIKNDLVYIRYGTKVLPQGAFIKVHLHEWTSRNVIQQKMDFQKCNTTKIKIDVYTQTIIISSTVRFWVILFPSLINVWFHFYPSFGYRTPNKVHVFLFLRGIIDKHYFLSTY